MKRVPITARAPAVVAKSQPIRVVHGEASVTMTPELARVIRAAIDEQRARERGSKA